MSTQRRGGTRAVIFAAKDKEKEGSKMERARGNRAEFESLKGGSQLRKAALSKRGGGGKGRKIFVFLGRGKSPEKEGGLPCA